MNALLNNTPPNSSNETVTINDTPVSMKLVQSIYNEITGKTETITKRLKDAHEITIDNIYQLDTKINQLHEQYNIISKNCSVTIYHIDDCKEQFSSFDRFKMYDSSSMSPCELIRLEYNFLICLPNTSHPQNYTITIDLHSRVGINRKMLSESENSRRFLRIIGQTTGNIGIEYVDYTVARNFMVAIEHWHASIKKNKLSKILNFLQNISEHFPATFQQLTILTLICIFYTQTEKYISSNPSINAVFSASIIIFGAIYFASLFALKMGRIFEVAIDHYQPISFININSGDKNALSDFNLSNKTNSFKLASSLSGALVINILSSFLAILLKIPQ